MRTRTALSLLFLCVTVSVTGQEVDAELSKLAGNLATLIKEKGKKKITVLDFADLQGRTSELGRYVAEQLTVDLVLQKGEFSILDRANLKSILAEHKLTAKGLIDPENAKKLGMFSGVDALIIGTLIPKKQTVALTARIITTDTAEVVGAAKAEFKTDETVQELLAAVAATADRSTADGKGEESDSPSIVKTFGDVRVEVEPLRIVNEHDLLLTMTVSNTSKKPTWFAVKRVVGAVSGAVFNSFGDQYTCYAVSGLAESKSEEGELSCYRTATRRIQNGHSEIRQRV